MLNGYLAYLYSFTIASYKVPSESINFHASKLNHMWQQIDSENLALNVTCEGRREPIVIGVITCFLDNRLAHKATDVN